jgi:hypothetical protein
MSVDPHEWHLLVEGPIQMFGRWYGTCRCSLVFKGNSRQDIYLKAQAHINQHQPPDRDGAA